MFVRAAFLVMHISLACSASSWQWWCPTDGRAECAGSITQAMDDTEEQLTLEAKVVQTELLQKKLISSGQSQVSSSHNCSKTLLPSLLYIGQEHAGSTGLAGLMELHPELSFGLTKEHRYGMEDRPRNELNERWWAKHDEIGWTGFPHTPAEYAAEFIVPCSVQHTFDATPWYYMMGGTSYPTYPAYGIQDFKDILGQDLQIMMMIRDPIDVNHSVNDDDGMWLDTYSCYANLLEKWLTVFPKENFLFLEAEDYFSDAQSTLDKVFEFRAVAPKTYSADELTQTSDSGRRRSATLVNWEPDVNSRRAFHTQDVNRDCRARLQNITGLPLKWEGAV